MYVRRITCLEIRIFAGFRLLSPFRQYKKLNLRMLCSAPHITYWCENRGPLGYVCESTKNYYS